MSAPTGWSMSPPDPSALPRDETIATRSRKRGSSFKVVGRRELPRRTMGDTQVAQWRDVVPVDYGIDEASLVRVADAILTAAANEGWHGDTDVYALIGRGRGRTTERGQTIAGREVRTDHRTPVTQHTLTRGPRKGQTVTRGGRRFVRGTRGVSHWRVVLDGSERDSMWCSFHEAAASECACSISVPTALASVSQGNDQGTGCESNGIAGAWQYGNRIRVRRGSAKLPDGVSPLARRDGTPLVIGRSRGDDRTAAVPVYGVTDGAANHRITHLVSWAEHGTFVGHELIAKPVSERATRVKRMTATERHAARRDAEQAARELIIERTAILEQVMRATTDQPVAIGPCYVHRQDTRYVVTYRDGTQSRHKTPVATVRALTPAWWADPAVTQPAT